jgi:hypothetical protein
MAQDGEYLRQALCFIDHHRAGMRIEEAFKVGS